jgi:hypothetical protein
MVWVANAVSLKPRWPASPPLIKAAVPVAIAHAAHAREHQPTRRVASG